MNPHETQTEPSVCLTYSVNFVVWEFRPKSSANEEFACKVDHGLEFIQRRNIAEIDTSKIATAWSVRQDHHPFWVLPLAKIQATYKHRTDKCTDEYHQTTNFVKIWQDSIAKTDDSY